MEFQKLVRERFSVRDYKDTPIEEEKLRKILEIGILAPTGANRQAYKIYAVTSKDKIEALRAVCPMAFNAPCVLAICADEEGCWHSPYEPGYNTYDIDGSIVTTHLMLAAWDLGIGSCWVRKYDKPPVMEALGIPENLTLMSLLPIGYAADGCEPAKKHFDTKTFEELVEYI